MFYPQPYDPLVLALILLPWIGVVMMRRSHGMFRADELRNDAHPNVAFALIFPPVMLSLRAILDYDVFQSALAVTLYVAVGGLLAAAILIVDPTQRRNKGTAALFCLLGLAYGYGTITQVNALLDWSPGTSYSATVQDKQIISGRSTTYELDLSAWGPETKINQLDVSRATYTQIEKGDVVELAVKKGAVGITWYYLRSWPSKGERTTSK